MYLLTVFSQKNTEENARKSKDGGDRKRSQTKDSVATSIWLELQMSQYFMSLIYLFYNMKLLHGAAETQVHAVHLAKPQSHAVTAKRVTAQGLVLVTSKQETLKKRTKNILWEKCQGTCLLVLT